MPHRRRPRFGGWRPVHLTLRVRKELGPLRKFELGRALRDAFVAGCKKPGFRICHFSLQHDHLHLVCDAKGSAALSRGIQGFSIRFARRLNKHLGRSGKVLADRYHLVILKVPRQVRNAICYVLQNGRRHRENLEAGWVVDPYSSGRYFDGWLEGLPDSLAPPEDDPPPVAPPHSPLLRSLWRKHGLIGLRETPRAAFSESAALLHCR